MEAAAGKIFHTGHSSSKERHTGNMKLGLGTLQTSSQSTDFFQWTWVLLCSFISLGLGLADGLSVVIYFATFHRTTSEVSEGHLGCF